MMIRPGAPRGAEYVRPPIDDHASATAAAKAAAGEGCHA